MAEEEVMDPTSPHRRSKSVPAMSPVGTDITELKSSLHRSRSNTADSVEKPLRNASQRLGSRLSSGGLLRSQSRKRRSKNGMAKLRSVDSEDVDESTKDNNSSIKYHHESCGLDAKQIRLRKQGLGALDHVMLRNTELDEDFPVAREDEQTNSTAISPSIDEESVGTREYKSMSTSSLHDEAKSLESSEQSEENNSDTTRPINNSDTTKPIHVRTDEHSYHRQDIQEKSDKSKKEPNAVTRRRRRSLPANLSKCEIDCDMRDYRERGHEYQMRYEMTNQDQAVVHNHDESTESVYSLETSSKYRWRSMPSSLSNIHQTHDTESTLPSQPETITFKTHPIDMGLQHSQADTNDPREACTESNPENIDSILHCTSDASSSDLVARLNVEDKMEEQRKDEQMILSEYGNVLAEPVFVETTRLEARHEQNDVQTKQVEWPANIDKETRYVSEKPLRKEKRRRRAKSLPSLLALAEIPEEREDEEHNGDKDQSIEVIAKKHVNFAFQELLKKIRNNQKQKPSASKARRRVRRTRSLSTIQESTAVHGEQDSQRELVLQKEQLAEEQPADWKTQEAQENGGEAGNLIVIDDHEVCQQLLEELKQKVFQQLEIQQEPHNEQRQELEQPLSKHLQKVLENHELNYEGHEQDHEGHEQDHEGHEQDHEGHEQDHEGHEQDHEGHEQDHEGHEQDHEGHEQGHELDHERHELDNEGHEQDHEGYEQDHEGHEQDHEGHEQDHEGHEQDHEGHEQDHEGHEQGHELDHEGHEQDHEGQEQDHEGQQDHEGHKLEINGKSIKENLCQQVIEDDADKEPDYLHSVGTPQILVSDDQFKIAELKPNYSPSFSRPRLITVPCMERIPEHPKEMLDSKDGAEVEMDRSPFQRTGSSRKISRGKKGKSSKPSRKRKKSWPPDNKRRGDECNNGLSSSDPRVRWAETNVDDHKLTPSLEGNLCKDEYEVGPRGDIHFIETSVNSSPGYDPQEDEFEDGPRGDLVFTDSRDAALRNSVPVIPRVEAVDERDTDVTEYRGLAMESKFEEKLREAINYYLEPDYSRSQSPLHRAVAQNCVERVCYLIVNGSDVNAVDEHGWPPLHVATITNHVDCAAVLIEAGADLHSYTDQLIGEYHREYKSQCLQ